MVSGLSEEELVLNMLALDAGLNEIAARFGEHVMLAYEDPVSFGAGHFVLYPAEASSPRFVIDEQYPDGVDWSDEDRVPASWTWASEVRAPRPDSPFPWMVLAEGEIESADYEKLLQIARTWAGTVHVLAIREAALTVDTLDQDVTGRDSGGRESGGRASLT